MADRRRESARLGRCRLRNLSRSGGRGRGAEAGPEQFVGSTHHEIIARRSRADQFFRELALDRQIDQAAELHSRGIKAATIVGYATALEEVSVRLV